MQWALDLFFRLWERFFAAPGPEPTGRTIDYSRPFWGHSAYCMRTWTRGRDQLSTWMGHGPGALARLAREAPGPDDRQIQPGDRLQIKTGLFLVEEIEYLRDPPDMWRATLRFERTVPLSPKSVEEFWS